MSYYKSNVDPFKCRSQCNVPVKHHCARPLVLVPDPVLAFVPVLVLDLFLDLAFALSLLDVGITHVAD